LGIRETIKLIHVPEKFANGIEWHSRLPAATNATAHIACPLSERIPEPIIPSDQVARYRGAKPAIGAPRCANRFLYPQPGAEI